MAGLAKLLKKPRRRRVFRVAGIYIVAAPFFGGTAPGYHDLLGRMNLAQWIEEQMTPLFRQTLIELMPL